MLGDSSGALQAMESMETRISPGGPAWQLQAWRLYCADILWLCDQQMAALAQAREAIGLPRTVLHATSYAGVYARWLALVSAKDGSSETPRRILEDLCSRMKEFDTLDRVEVIAARLILEGRRAADLEVLLRKYLLILPPAVAIQLRRLGLQGT
jgi:hypothetical protein